MSIFAVQWLESVRKDGKLKFYKLLKDEEAPFDLFYEEVIKDAKHKKDILHILSMMDLDIFVVKGGYKKNQVRDIKYLKRLLKENKDLKQILQIAKP